MKDIEFHFVTTNSLVSRIIRMRTGSEISHVDVVDPNGLLLGSQRGDKTIEGLDGVGYRYPGYETFTKTIKLTLDISDTTAVWFWEFLHSQIGKPYDLSAVIDIGLGLTPHKDWRTPDSWFCSELFAAAFEQVGLLDFGHSNRVTPQMLLEVLSKSQFLKAA